MKRRYGSIMAIALLVFFCCYPINLNAASDQLNQSLYNAVRFAENGKDVIVELDKIEKALKDGADPNWINHENGKAKSVLGNFVLLLGFSSNEKVTRQGLLAIRSLFAAGAKLQYCDDAILYWPIARGKYDLVKLLLENGASATSWAKDKIGSDKSPIQVATAKGYQSIVYLLVAHGAKQPSDKEAMQIRFVQVAKSGSLNELKSLVKEGAVIDGDGPNGETALINVLGLPIIDDASSRKVMYLLDAGADVNHKGKGFAGNTTPLHQAIFYSSIIYKTNRDKSYSEKILRELLSRGAHVSAQDDSGKTPLHIAAENNHFFVARLLIEAGAEVMPKDNKGKTPLDYAAAEEMIELIKKQGAKE